MKNKEEVLGIISEFIDIHDSKRAEVFIDIIGHVDILKIDVHIPKWESSKTPTFTCRCYINDLQSVEEFCKNTKNFIKIFNSSV